MLAPMRPKPIIAISIYLTRSARARSDEYIASRSSEYAHHCRTSHRFETAGEQQRTGRGIQVERGNRIAALIARIKKCSARVDAQPARRVRVHPRVGNAAQLTVAGHGENSHGVVQT